jgi:hypothetical protein
MSKAVPARLEPAPEIFVEPWSSGYGSPLQIDEGDEGNGAAQLIPEEGFEFVRPAAGGAGAIAFIDGVRRQEAALSQLLADGRYVPGIAGAYATGAVLSDGEATPIFTKEKVERLIVWSGGANGGLPALPAGWSWTVASTPDSSPQAPVRKLQELMRRAEARLGDVLATEGYLVLLDGTLWFAANYEKKNIAGYIKTHHVRLLPEAEARRLPELPAGWRTSIFRTPANRYTCYLRLTERTSYAPPLAGVVRLEFSGTIPLDEARQMAERFAAALPRYAGVAHADPRAPQNLQPVGALENRLRHLLGDGPMAERAVRDAVRLRKTEGERNNE